MDFNGILEKIGEYGNVLQARHPIVVANGLPGARLHEIIFFETGEMGEVFLIERNTLEILVFSQNSVAVGTKITRTGTFLSMPVGDALLGSMIDPMGKNLSASASPKTLEERREIDVPPLGIDRRARIRKPFTTGVTIVDTMVPLGMGQKELVIGDRKTGKTSFLLATIKSQVMQGSVAIYVGIAKRKSDIKKVRAYFAKEEITKSTIIVATTSYDSPSLIYLTPYSAVAIAEYFRDKGINVVIVFDDLTTHAMFYREISLLAKRFPGRDSYPGDIFNTHAKLLERSGNFKLENGTEVSITMLPVAEIVEGDLTGYITTNLMSMTDGHIFFDSNIFYEGRRPAVNVPLSVTRVGRQAQTALLRSINREIGSFLTLYEKVQNLSHFGAELNDTVKGTLSTGENIYKYFNQHYSVLLPLEVQVVLFALLWLNFLDKGANSLEEHKTNMMASFQIEKNKPLFEAAFKKETFNKLLEFVAQNKDTFISLCKIENK